ncbi:hypothetical protein [Corynebacterium timonense]|uniref:Transposase DDE domain-containing protein n=1 Tax=Corynebacterium timonense TaxID=441500 RepID=A0A1H1RB82_9CORY|nr:hypothetical protein [Corynebacterium timonense]SDS32169.1 hypothetical protein SAMN04488539_1443 [Corynebacterium timonense]
MFVSDTAAGPNVKGGLRVLTRASARVFNSGRAVTVETVLGESNLTAVLEGLKSRNSVADERYMFRLIHEALHGQELSLYHRRDIEKPPAKPYEPGDWQRLHHWVVSQSTELRRERATVIVGLGLGAGLGPGVALIKAGDVALDANGVVRVAVTHRAAEDAAPAVPAAAALARSVWEVAQKRAPDDLLLGGSETDIREITKRLNLNRSFPKVCQQRTVTLKNTAEDGAKFLQHGPAFMTAEWRKEYGRRNTIESRNAMLKNGSYQGAGDVTTRLMRGWAAQMLCMAMAAVGVNLAMLDAASWSRPHTEQKPSPPAPRGGRRPDSDDIEQWKLGDNAPPKAA